MVMQDGQLLSLPYFNSSCILGARFLRCRQQGRCTVNTFALTTMLAAPFNTVIGLR